MTNDVFLKGQLEITLVDSNNTIKNQIIVPNLVVATGKQYLAKLLAAESVPAMSHMAVGTASTAANANDTALGSELLRVALDDVTRTDASVTFKAIYGTGSSGSITEAGIFNDATTGTLLCRTVFGVITKTETDFLTINWTVTVS